MNNQIIKLAGIAIACIVISACDTDFDNPVGDSSSYSSGDADFTSFVAIGDSLTAGYADAALYLHGQENSYPSILAQQFATVGGGSFKQPLVDDDGLGGLLIDGAFDPDPGYRFGNRFVLNMDPDPDTDDERPVPERLEGTPTTEAIGSGLNGNVFNNIGVPGAKSFHLLSPDYGNPAGLGGGANPYFVRFASDIDASMIADAAAQQPSFYVMYIGENDVLSYATSGGTGTDRTGDIDPGNVAGYGPDDITDPDVFAYYYDLLVKAFKGANPDVKGVLINIPDVRTIPFFTTVPYNAIPLEDTPEDKAKINALNAGYAEYNDGLQLALAGNVISAEEAAQRTITFAVGLNAVVILDDELTLIGGPETFLRQATAEDLLLLTTSSKIGELVNPDDDPDDPASLLWGVSAPLLDSDVLIPSEIRAIDIATTAFNAAIKAEADDDENLLFVDMAAIMKTLSTTGIDYGTGFINATFATGGGFSLDGVHPTARGYAVITNGIIDAINTGFNANIPPVDPGSYTTIFVK